MANKLKSTDKKVKKIDKKKDRVENKVYAGLASVSVKNLKNATEYSLNLANYYKELLEESNYKIVQDLYDEIYKTKVLHEKMLNDLKDISENHYGNPVFSFLIDFFGGYDLSSKKHYFIYSKQEGPFFKINATLLNKNKELLRESIQDFEQIVKIYNEELSKVKIINNDYGFFEDDFIDDERSR